MGLATTTKRGQAVEVQARRDTPVFRPLAELLSLTYGPAVVLPNYLAGIPGIEGAFIYGSWAARQAGEPGNAPGDIDLLIVGNPSRAEVYEAARLAGSSIALLWPRWTISNLLRAISIGVSLLLAVFFIYLYEDLYRSPPTLENHWRHYKEFWVFYILAYFFTGHCLGQIGKLVCKRP